MTAKKVMEASYGVFVQKNRQIFTSIPKVDE
jgi:hypothetical protein